MNDNMYVGETIGENNQVCIPVTVRLENVSININGNNNKVFMGDWAMLKDFNIKIKGNNHSFILGQGAYLWGGDAEFEDTGNTFIVGPYSEIHYAFNVGLCENNKRIEIGGSCLFSNNVRIKCADAHTVIDKNTGKVLNAGKDVVIKDKVWIGEHVLIMKGSVIEKECVVGAGSIVTKQFPPNCVIAGNPAKIIRTDTSWSVLRILE